MQGLRAVPRGVWALGLVSMLMDVSSEMIHALLPLFLVSSLGASVALVGLIEGVAEATASITKVFSGWLSDRLGNRKWLAVAGYGLAAVTKPLFPLATTAMAVFVARFADRIGKGMRGAPRDALVADLTPPKARGAAFGLRQSLDTIGAFAGPLFAIALMALTRDDIRTVFAWAVVPAVAAVTLLVLAVREPRRPPREKAAPPIAWSEVRALGPALWQVLAVGAIFTLARFSEAFLVLRAADVGLPLMLVPGVMVVMNVVYAAVAAPAGVLSDKLGRRGLLAAGLAVLIAADLVLARFPTVTGVLAGVALWGLHMGLSQGLLAAMVADTAPARLRGTAFGLFNLVSGVALLAASVIAGWLWTSVGPAATFLAGAAFTVVALTGFLLLPRDGPARAA
jgi:MFS family permease